MPAGQGKDEEERFAASVERGRPRGYSDTEFANELAIVARLRAERADLDPTPAEKARARRLIAARLVAQDSRVDPAAPRLRATAPGSPTEVTARIVRVPARSHSVDGKADQHAAVDADHPAAAGRAVTSGRRSKRVGRHTRPSGTASRPSRPEGARRPGVRGPARRAMLVASAALLALIAIAGTGVFASRNALPGDSLYTVKRVAESAGLALTFNDAAKASRNLELATTRLSEVQQLVDHGRQDTADPQLVQEAISDFDSSTDAGSQVLLTDNEVHDPTKLAGLRDWADDQATTLNNLRPGLPAVAQDEVDRSIELLTKMSTRATALAIRAGCTDITSGQSAGGQQPPAKDGCPTDGDGDQATQGPPTSAGADSTDPATPTGAGTVSASATPGGILPDAQGDLGATPAPGSSTDPTFQPDSGSAPSVDPTSDYPTSGPPPPIQLPAVASDGSGITIG